MVFGGLAAFQYIVKPRLIADFVGGMKPPPVVISATEAKRKAWQPELSAIGTLEAIRGVSIAPAVGGRVEAIHFESGQAVEKGALLVELDSSIEEAQLKEAEAALRLANLELARGETLYEKRDFSKANLDKARAQRDQAEAKVDSLKATIRQKKIAAPFAGRLGIRQINLGQFLSAGTAIVPLQSLDPIFVNFSLPETQFPKIAVGQTVTLTADGFPGRTIEGKITSIDSRIDQSTRNILVQATIDNPDRKLIPGMFANVRVRYAAPRERVTVPQTAVSYSLYGDAVFVVSPSKTDKDSDGKPVTVVNRRAVTVGDRRGDEVAIETGLEAGEMIVTSGQIKLRNGAQVTVNNDVQLNPADPRPRP